MTGRYACDKNVQEEEMETRDMPQDIWDGPRGPMTTPRNFSPEWLKLAFSRQVLGHNLESQSEAQTH